MQNQCRTKSRILPSVSKAGPSVNSILSSTPACLLQNMSLTMDSKRNKQHSFHLFPEGDSDLHILPADIECVDLSTFWKNESNGQGTHSGKDTYLRNQMEFWLFKLQGFRLVGKFQTNVKCLLGANGSSQILK